MYIDLLAILDTLPDEIYHQIINAKQRLVSLKTIDCPEVFKFKIEVLGKIFDLVKDKFAKSEELDKFIKENESWLKPYALFIMLRAMYDELDFHKWPEQSHHRKSKISPINTRKNLSSHTGSNTSQKSDSKHHKSTHQNTMFQRCNKATSIFSCKLRFFLFFFFEKYRFPLKPINIKE